MEYYENVKDIITDPHYNKITSLELIIGTKCQNACKYCYRVKNQQEGSIIGMPVSRAKMYIDNAIEMGLIDSHLNEIELFGGDSLVDLDYLMSMCNMLKEYADFIIVPTNGRLLERIKDADIDELLDSSDGKLRFSLSVDSPYQEENRPLSEFGKMQGMKQERNWDRLFHIAKKYNCGFHPMLSFDTVDKWYDTWKFFVDNGFSCYLLEIRHSMTDEQIYEGVYQLVKIIKEINNLNLENNFNITRPAIVSRGIPCSMQTTLGINIDGCVYTCHRLMNERFKLVDLNTKEIDSSKFVMWYGLYDRRNQQICMSCPIRKICSGQCLGAMYEYWGYGAVTTPIPSLCRYFLLKNYIFAEYFEEWNKFVKQYINFNELEHAIMGNFGKKNIEEFKEKLNNV